MENRGLVNTVVNHSIAGIQVHLSVVQRASEEWCKEDYAMRVALRNFMVAVDGAIADFRLERPKDTGQDGDE